MDLEEKKTSEAQPPGDQLKSGEEHDPKENVDLLSSDDVPTEEVKKPEGAGKNTKNNLEQPTPGDEGKDPGKPAQEADKEETAAKEETTDKEETVDNNQTEESADLDEEDTAALDFTSPPETLDDAARLLLYSRGQDLLTRGRAGAALRCFLRCMSGLGETTAFAYLPQCLRQVADIYYRQEEYEKAVQFIQAEKLYYETALVDTTNIQQKLAEKNKSTDPADPDAGPDEDTMTEDVPDVVRANEYEELAQMCLQKQQPQLALEYQAKATKLKQQCLGEDHPLTRKSLDFFTIVYGEVGKQQYSESVQKLTVPAPSQPQEGGEGETGGLRQRAGKGDGKHGGSEGAPRRLSKKEAAEREAERAAERAAAVRYHEESVSRALLLVLFGLCCVVLVVVGVYLYCRVAVPAHSCAAWRSELHYRYMRVKYWYYSLTRDGKTYG